MPTAVPQSDLFRVERRDDLAIIWLDQQGEQANRFSSHFLDQCSGLLDTLEREKEVKGLVLISGKPDHFIAGAHLAEFLNINQPGPAEALSRKSHGLFNRIANFPKPIVAAIHGAALGAGCELALACRYRIATEARETVIAQSEVKLGLSPGGGATQRLPRLIGVQPALELLLTGRNVAAKEALKLGLVDQLIHPHALLEAGIAAARLLSRKRARAPRKPQGFGARLAEKVGPGRKRMYKKALELVARQGPGTAPAALKILECVEIGLEKGADAGYEAEIHSFGALLISPPSKHLMHLFLATAAKSQHPPRRQVGRLVVIGAGVMGSGIAGLSIDAGLPVVLNDVNQAALGKGEKRIWSELQQRVEAGEMTAFERDRVFSRLTGTTDELGFQRADLAIEAVFENLDVKKQVLKHLEAHTRAGCILASNTASIPIGEIARAVAHPGRVVGMHYFSPVAKMPLLEIIATPETEARAVATALEVGIRQGKTCIVVKDGPGFYTTRILAPLMNEALILVQEGAAVEAIDLAMKQFGFPVGPLTTMDEVGIDVAAQVSRVMSPAFEQRGFTPSRAAEQLFEAGFLGRKNRLGFYKYPRPKDDGLPKKKRKKVNTEVYRFFGRPPRRQVAAEEIQQRLAFAMMNEAAYCLQEEIVASPQDGDLGAVLGLGFPAFLGGPFRAMDSWGAAVMYRQLGELARKHGPRFVPAALLRRMAEKNKSFYSS